MVDEHPMLMLYFVSPKINIYQIDITILLSHHQMMSWLSYMIIR